MTQDESPTALIIGASSTIANAIIRILLLEEYRVVAVSRSAMQASDLSAHTNLTWLTCDYSEAQIKTLLRNHAAALARLNRVFILNGILHNDHLSPEKQIAQLESENFMESITVNTLIPILWLKHLYKMLDKSRAVQIVVFSARVGSIEDNHLGGWYSYRASKSALNMMLKSYAIELNRRHKSASILVFHPGTTDTPLSQPFQRNVPPEKLFKPSFVAEALLRILAEDPFEENIRFLDWNNKAIPW